MLYANNKDADQPAHPRSLISAFVVCCQDSVIPLVSIPEISSIYLASVTAQVGLSLPWSQTSKIGFLVTRLIVLLLVFMISHFWIAGSRIGRQPNAVKHEISLELKQGVKNPSNKERHTSGPVEIKKEPRRKRHTSSPIVIEDGQQKHRHTSGPVKIKQEPQEFREGCCMSGIRKSWEGWGTDEVQPVLEHSVELPGLISSKSFPRSPLVASKGKSGTIFRDMLLNNVSSENTSEVGGKSKDNIPEKKIPSEVPLSANVSLDNVSCTSAGTQNIDSQKPELQGSLSADLI